MPGDPDLVLIDTSAIIDGRLVDVLRGRNERSCALIPGTCLLLFGALLGTPYRGITDYLWPAILIILGGYFVLRFFINRPSS